MKGKAKKVGLGPNISNHSGRKTMTQTLSNNDAPQSHGHIVQLSDIKIGKASRIIQPYRKTGK
jgi:hypothetical protein